MKGHHRPFLTLWVLAVGAAVLAFVVHLAMRGRTVALAYDLGKARAEQARLREVRRVLELEVASYQTPQRVEMVARSVLRMTPPSADRILAMTTPGAAAPTDPATPLPKASAAPPRGAAAPRGSASSREAAAPAPTELLLPRITPPKPAQALSANPQAEVSPE